jgi:hypothetical protein
LGWGESWGKTLKGLLPNDFELDSAWWVSFDRMGYADGVPSPQNTKTVYISWGCDKKGFCGIKGSLEYFQTGV